jgi:predicted RND superfamily exporter protein
MKTTCALQQRFSMTNEFEGMTLEQIKEKINAKPKHIPDTVLDTAAMHAAIDRFQAEKQAKEIREWLVYEAPPGMYDFYVEEKAKLEKQAKEQQKAQFTVALLFVLFIMGMVVWNIFEALRPGVPR